MGLTPEPGEPGSSARGAHSGAGTEVRKVLLVDDDPSLRMLYRFNLEASILDFAALFDYSTAQL